MLFPGKSKRPNPRHPGWRVGRDAGRRGRPEQSEVPQLEALQLTGPVLPDRGFSDHAFQRHAALLGDSRLAQPMYTRQRAMLVRQLQRDYGNRYVQRLVSHISSGVSPAKPGVVQVNPRARREPTIQRVAAYRVEYSHNSKVATDGSGKVGGLTTPIDISFVLPDHSQYFASERKQDQIAGLRLVEWEMNDDWWAAVRHLMRLDGDKLSGKAKSWYDLMNKKLGTPSWSDGASLTKFIKQTALHFDKSWQVVLNKAIVSGTGQVRDLETEYYEKQSERDAKEKKVREDKDEERLGDTVTVWAWMPGDDPATDGFDAARGEALDMGAKYMSYEEAIAAGHTT